jgi:cobyrinic acid a,c-diamide synthase
VRCAYRVQRGHGIGGGRDGVLVHNVLASYAHLRHTGGNDWPRRFMAFVRDTRERRVAAPTLVDLNLPQEAAWSTP